MIASRQRGEILGYCGSDLLFPFQDLEKITGSMDVEPKLGALHQECAEFEGHFRLQGICQYMSIWECHLPSLLLRSVESRGFEMLIVAEVFAATFREHHFKGDTIGEAETAFPGLPRPSCAELVNPLINPHNPASHH